MASNITRQENDQLSENIDEPEFRVDLSLLKELGERLISRDEVAVVELVKNSYDADGELVTVQINDGQIIVEDDGVGMNYEQIIQGWLTVSTPIKRKNTLTKKGRRVLGEKGLGRLAALKLGKYVTIYTKKINGLQYKITMDWASSSEKLKSNEFVSIDEMICSVKKSNEYTFKKRKGTVVIISKLNNEWKNRNIKSLGIYLQRLIQPTPIKLLDEALTNQDDFQIEYQNIIIEPPEFTTNPHYILDYQIKDDGSFNGKIKTRYDIYEQEMDYGHIEEKKYVGYKTKIEWNKNKNGGCGGFRFVLNVWDLDSDDLKNNKGVLKGWSGISLFRNGFRILQSGNDWLGLGLRRVQNPTLRLSTNQIIGSLMIDSDANLNLIDKTDREGLIENNAFNQMKESIFYFMNILETKRKTIRQDNRAILEVYKDYLDTKEIRSLAYKLPAEQKNTLMTHIKKIDEFSNILGQWVLGRDRLAAIGLMAEMILHTGGNALSSIVHMYPSIEQEIEELNETLKNNIKAMVEGAKMISSLFNKLEDMTKYKILRKKEMNIKSVAENIKFIYGPFADNHDIKINIDIKEDVYLRMNPTDPYVILSNLVDNSIYWLTKVKRINKFVKILHYSTDSNHVIEVIDNGPGIAKDIIDNMFKIGFSKKIGGSGLGLTIVKDTVNMYEGNVVASNNESSEGAKFTIILPKKTVDVK